MQSEFYGEESRNTEKGVLEPSFQDGLAEHPKFVVFNGKVSDDALLTPRLEP